MNFTTASEVGFKFLDALLKFGSGFLNRCVRPSFHFFFG